MFSKYLLISATALFLIGCGGSQGENSSNSQEINGFKGIQAPKNFNWSSSNTLSLDITVKERVVKRNTDNTLTSYVTAVENAIVVFGYQDKNVTTLKTDLDGKILLKTKLPSHVESIDLFATSNGFTQKKTVSLENINNKQIILIDRSPEPTQNELDQEGK